MLRSSSQLRTEVAAAQQPRSGCSQQAGADSHAKEVRIHLDSASLTSRTPTTRRYTESESSFGVLQGDRALPSALEGKLMVEREHLYSQLVDVKEKMVRLVHLSCY